MREPTDRECELEIQLDDAERAAIAMAKAWRDVFNDVGNIAEVRKHFESVERHINEFEGR